MEVVDFDFDEDEAELVHEGDKQNNRCVTTKSKWMIDT